MLAGKETIKLGESIMLTYNAYADSFSQSPVKTFCFQSSNNYE
jgi:hypothetical protein